MTPAILRRDIQGLRGVAVLLVVLYHAGLPLFPGGFVGVDVFFVISGYLITGLLVKDLAGSGRIAFTHFYARRIRRLLPAALFLVLCVAACASFVYSPYERDDVYQSLVASALYAANLWFARNAVDYLGGDLAANPMLHMWSLAIEEQFYLVWPLLIGLCGRGASPANLLRRVTTGVVGVSVLSFAACVWVTWRSQPWGFFGTPFRAWEFGLGALVFLLGAHAARMSHGMARVLGWVGAAAVIASAVALRETTLFPGALALAPAGGTALVLAAIHGTTPLALRTFLSSWPMKRLGDISYSLYLWHWPLLVFAAMLFAESRASASVGAIVIALLAASASYRFLENPIRHNRALDRRDGLAVVFGILGSVVVAFAVHRLATATDEVSAAQRRYVATRSDKARIYDDGCHAGFDATDLPACSYGRQDGPRTVVLFGDSHAAQWFPAIERLAQEKGWRLLSLTKSACPSIDVEVFSTAKRRPYFECEQWRSRMIERIVKERPVWVVISNSSRYGIAPEVWKAGAARLLQRLSPAGAYVAVIRDVPWVPADPLTCLSRAEWRGRAPAEGCAFDLKAALAPGLAIFTAEASAVSFYPRGLMLDLTSTICPTPKCTLERAGDIVYRDSNHLTASFSKGIAPAIEARLAPKE